MAWLYKHPKSGRWFLGWRVGKTVFNRSTGTINRKEAEKQLGTCELMVEASHQGKLTEAVYRSLTGQSVERIPLKAAVEDYLKRVKARISIGTFRAYRSALNGLLESVHAGDTTPALGDVNKSALEKYLSGVRERASATTTNNQIKFLGAFFRDADEKYHTGDPTKGLDRYNETPAEADEPDRRPFTADELRKIHSVAPAGFWKFAILCAYWTGFRLGRIATMQWQHVDFSTAKFNIKDVKPQKKKKVPVPISAPLMAEIRALRAKAGAVKPTDFLWPEQAATYRASGAASLSAEFHKLVLVPAKLALPYQRGRERRAVNEISFHSIKHTLVTTMKEMGAPEMVVRGMVGHDSAAVSAVYTHATAEMAREHIKKLPSPFKAKRGAK